MYLKKKISRLIKNSYQIKIEVIFSYTWPPTKILIFSLLQYALRTPNSRVSLNVLHISAQNCDIPWSRWWCSSTINVDLICSFWFVHSAVEKVCIGMYNTYACSNTYAHGMQSKGIVLSTLLLMQGFRLQSLIWLRCARSYFMC